MNRRTILFGLPSLSVAFQAVEVGAAAEPWQARFLSGSFEGNAWSAGLRIILQPGWKTYWRMPGATGIAPSIEAHGENLKSMSVLYPMPTRLKSGEDDVIGYKDEVVFPMRLEPLDKHKDLMVTVKAFLGVCDQVCIPVRAEGAMSFNQVSSSDAENMEIETWIGRQPQAYLGMVTKAVAELDENSLPVLKISFAQPIQDVFVEGKATHYFHPPVISGMQAAIKVSGAKTLDELKGVSLRLTIATLQGGVEETVTVV